jgi:hypothetical protein
VPRAKGRKGKNLKIVGYAADSVLQMFVAKINQEAETKVAYFEPRITSLWKIIFKSFPLHPSAYLCAMLKIVDYAADSVLQMFVAKINQKAKAKAL